jgi:hypothetical protein
MERVVMEYQFFVCNGETFNDDETRLNELAEDGWRVITMSLPQTKQGHAVLLLGRELPNE